MKSDLIVARVNLAITFEASKSVKVPKLDKLITKLDKLITKIQDAAGLELANQELNGDYCLVLTLRKLRRKKR